MSRILTVEQAAEKLQLTVKVVREYLRVGKLPGRKVGRAWRVLESDLETWISTGQSETRVRVSARGLMKQFSGTLSSEQFMAEKHAETRSAEGQLRRRLAKPRGETA